jgi:hypothetical protein
MKNYSMTDPDDEKHWHSVIIEAALHHDFLSRLNIDSVNYRAPKESAASNQS